MCQATRKNANWGSLDKGKWPQGSLSACVVRLVTPNSSGQAIVHSPNRKGYWEDHPRLQLGLLFGSLARARTTDSGGPDVAVQIAVPLPSMTR